MLKQYFKQAIYLLRIAMRATRRGLWDSLNGDEGLLLITMAAIPALGIWYPALQVMHIQPADALHEE